MRCSERSGEFLQWRQGDAIILAEANVLPGNDMSYFGEAGDRVQMMFNFAVNQTLFYALATADNKPLIAAMEATEPRPATGQWGLFLRNHDELDLGRLTKTQRQAVFNAFGPDADMQLYGRGIRRRLAPMLSGDRRRLEMAYSLMLTLPGTPVIRYGDEIGMGDDLRLPERNCARTPMQWSSASMGGFTDGDTPIFPPVNGGPYGFQHVNVSAQRRDPKSMLNWTERVIRMRKELPEVGWGQFKVVETGRDDVLAVCYTWQNKAALFIHNLSEKPGEVRFDLGSAATGTGYLTNLLSDHHSKAKTDGKYCILMEPFGYRWFRVGDIRAGHLIVIKGFAILSCRGQRAVDNIGREQGPAFCRQHARFKNLQIPVDWPSGEKFDLIVCSEVLYYLSPVDIQRVSELAFKNLLPDGNVLLVNYTEKIDEPCSGDEAAEAFIHFSRNFLAVQKKIVNDNFRIDLLIGFNEQEQLQ